MRRFMLTLALSVTALALLASESQAGGRRRVVTTYPVYSPSVTYGTTVSGNAVVYPTYPSIYGNTSVYGSATVPVYNGTYYGNTYYPNNYGGYYAPAYSNPGLLGAVGNFGTNVIDGTANFGANVLSGTANLGGAVLEGAANVLTFPLRALR